MYVVNDNKFICYVLAIIVLFVGIGNTTNSSFLHAENTECGVLASICAVEEVEDAPICTLSMLHGRSFFQKLGAPDSMMRWQNRINHIFPIMQCFLQDLFCYQKAESKEDGQLFLCRSAIIDYIHLKDSGE